MASNRTLGKTKRPKLFSPAVSRDESKYSVTSPKSLKSLTDTNFGSTSSFRYDDPGSGVKSTQEIPLDWSKFENHTFFNSAQSKVNVAFDRIVNEYPFDGSQREVEAFEDSLTGYENYILDIFPKNNGFLLLSGTSVTENPLGGHSPHLGTVIKVFDSTGYQFPDFSKKNDGAAVIDFKTKPFSFEFFFRPPEEDSGRQIIFQKRKSNHLGVTVALNAASAGQDPDVIFSVNSGSARMAVSASIERGKFSHICATYDRDNTRNLQIYVSESLVAISPMGFELDSLSLDRAPLYIGSGSTFHTPRYFDFGAGSGEVFIPQQTLSGSIDEVRIFHGVRPPDVQKLEARKGIFASDDLKLYFKFNEPSGSFNVEDVVLDHSGNSLHSRISNFFKYDLRATGSISNPMTAETLKRCPILFPSFKKVGNLNIKMLSSASYYDSVNPNLITKLIPSHFLLEGQEAQGFQDEEGNISNPVTANSIPGSAKIGSAQYLTAFLLLWSKFFDEIKVFIDHFSDLIHPSYDDTETVASKFLPFVANYYGIDLPPMFPDTDPTQYVDGENIDDDYSKSLHALNYIQTEIWRRILINLNEIIVSKGTIYSIKAFIRAAGINPDNLMNIREYGGPTKRELVGLRETKSEVASSIDFSGSLGRKGPGTTTPQGYISNFPHIISPFLSSSRVEVGYPSPSSAIFVRDGTPVTPSFIDKKKFFPHGIYDRPDDGLLTSGSFAYEGIYQFSSAPGRTYSQYQCLARLHVSASEVIADPAVFNHGIAVANLLVLSGTENSLSGSGSTIRLYMRPGLQGNDPLLKMDLVGPDIFDGNLWNISFGRTRSDEKIETSSTKYLGSVVSTAGSSSYFLRAARQAFGELKATHATSSFFRESRTSGLNVFQSLDDVLNPSGTMITVGSQSMSKFTSPAPTTDVFLNDPLLDTRPGAKSGDRSLAMYTTFEGQVSQIRFWSKRLLKKNWYEHVRNFKSVGVSDPRVNFNFDVYPTGAFERLRVDVSTDQDETSSNETGEIQLIDFSQNNFHFSGGGFEPSKVVIKPETFYFSHLSPKFDQAQTDNKVRIRSFETSDLIDLYPYATSAPSFEVLRSEEPFDDVRFSIEFSAVKALDEDMMNIFGTLEFFDNALGKTNLLFDDFYPDIDQARKIYFKRLTEKPDYQIFFDMYKWFNSALGVLVYQLIPRKTKFLGINFVIESHVLERNRFRYLFDDIYLLSLERDTDRGNLLLSQFAGSLCKY